MKFFGEKVERKEVTIIVEEIFNPWNVFSEPAVINMLWLFQIISLRGEVFFGKTDFCQYLTVKSAEAFRLNNDWCFP